ncbi:hypothetical protein [Leptospira bandrabouensis]|uniref:hypothetical protein n=1 Tax=Leptospira bandrabouensis TaxID=2484903 RepID=UPI001EE9072D|nr:hypothetical protein [Leptospira bandrabouensis]MCG6146606.1 hypothetical protein [Leptospira bandrabouensis]MCG6161938.1 hypothetical protein [Leptospira bandrabouensis]MCG6166187.1 hypothetical protein [Leptospira bandrabouensis]
MKQKILTLLIILLPSILNTQYIQNDQKDFQPKWKSGDILTVFAPNGLYLYKEICIEEYQCDSLIIKYLPRNTKIIFKEIATSHLYNYFGINAPMIKVSVDNTDGFLYSGLLSTLPPIPKNCNNFKDYLESNFGPSVDIKLDNWCISEYGEHCGETFKTIYKKGIIHDSTFSSGTNGMDIQSESIINLTNSLHEAFLIALNCSHSDIKNYEFNKFEKDNLSWRLESNNPNLCEYNKDDEKPLKSINYNLRFYYEKGKKSELTINRDTKYSDNCK